MNLSHDCSTIFFMTFIFITDKLSNRKEFLYGGKWVTETVRGVCLFVCLLVYEKCFMSSI